MSRIWDFGAFGTRTALIDDTGVTVRYDELKDLQEQLSGTEDDGKLTVIEEYVSGRTLREYLDDRNLLAENCAVKTVCKLGQILMQLHHFKRVKADISSLHSCKYMG